MLQPLAPMANIIDLVNPSTFNSSEWIGKGKKYNIKTLPYVAIEACTSATIIPAEYKKEFPSYHLSVLEFLKIPLIEIARTSIAQGQEGSAFLVETY